jgi:hypothetical protein
MSKSKRSAAILAAAMIGAFVTAPCRAQVIIGRGRGIALNVPAVGVRIGPLGGYGLYGAVPRPLIAGPYGIQPYDALPLYGTSPANAGGPIRRFVGRPRQSPDGAARSAPLPTEAELRTMDDSALLNAALRVGNRLDADLGGFTSANTWRPYLRLPDDALPPAGANRRVRLRLESITETLNRFETAAANPEYQQITGLPSFSAMRDVLQELVRRYGGAAPAIAQRSTPHRNTPSIEMQNLHAATPNVSAAPRRTMLRQDTAVKPASGEELPTPPPALVPPKNEPALQPPQNNVPAEHSILSK